MNENLFENPAAPASSEWYIAHCDGGSRGNPGPSGYGAVIHDLQGRTVARLSEFLGSQTNNYAEYQGLLAVLRWAAQNAVRQLRVVSDSELMVKQMQGKYKVQSPILRPLWEEARSLARQLDRFEIRHTLRGGNQEADRLANQAMDKGMVKSREPGTGGAGKQKAGEQIQPPFAQAGKTPPQPPRQVLEGFVKNGVVHLLDGTLPDGLFVKIVRE